MDKKGKAEKKQAASVKRLEKQCAEEPKSDIGPAIRECDKDAVIRMREENEENRKLVERKLVESNTEVEKKMREYLAAVHEFSGRDERQVETLDVESGG